MRTLLICMTMFLQGCFFGRADYETWDDFSQEKVRASVTVVTIGKKIVIDPNGYFSDPEKASAMGPWGAGSIGE